MSKFDGPEYLPDIASAVKFLSDDAEEVRAWAREHAKEGWWISKGNRLWTLDFTHKEGDAALFPFTYVWDGEKIVKKYSSLKR